MAADPMKALATAIQHGDAAEARRMLAEHPDLKHRLDEPLPGGSFGGTALLTAANDGNRELVDLLLCGAG